MDALFFDLDGTLVDSASEIRSCLLDSFQEQGISLRENMLSRFRIGSPIDDMVRIMVPSLPEQSVCAVVAAFRARYDRSDYTQTLPFPGINDLLEKLSAACIPLYVATNKPLFASTRIVQKKGWRCFKDILSPNRGDGARLSKARLLQRCAEEHGYRPGRCVMIGDLQDDVEAAHTAGFLSAWVSWGYGDKTQAGDGRADWMVEKPSDLLSALKEPDGV